MHPEELLKHYIAGWKAQSADQILNTLAEDSLIIEPHGPTYQGKKEVAEWIATWHGEGHYIIKWDITSLCSCHDQLFCE